VAREGLRVWAVTGAVRCYWCCIYCSTVFSRNRHTLGDWRKFEWSFGSCNMAGCSDLLFFVASQYTSFF
jgi:hypothetical protein